jgi:hypothetical protein
MHTARRGREAVPEGFMPPLRLPGVPPGGQRATHPRYTSPYGTPSGR